MKSLRRWVGFWWISWFGILGGFFMVGVGEYRHESPTARYFSLILMIVIGFFWVIFFVADTRFDGGERTKSVVDLLTLMGTFLAVFSLLGIGFFVVIAPRVP